MHALTLKKGASSHSAYVLKNLARVSGDKNSLAVPVDVEMPMVKFGTANKTGGA